MRRLASLALAIAVLIPSVLHADLGWAPAEHREAVAQVIAARLAAIDVEDRLTDEEEAEAAQAAVDGVAAKVGAMGLEAVIRIAPTFPHLELPSSGNPALDAVAAFQLCSLPVEAIFYDGTPRDNRYDERAQAVSGSAAMFVVSSYLRLGYLESGVSDEEAGSFLQGETMAALKARIVRNKELLDSTQSRCADPVMTLMQ